MATHSRSMEAASSTATSADATEDATAGADGATTLWADESGIGVLGIVLIVIIVLILFGFIGFSIR